MQLLLDPRALPEEKKITRTGGCAITTARTARFHTARR
jgi:hypothetical protein